MSDSRSEGMHPAWWTLILVTAIIGIIALTSALFSGAFKSYVPVTVVSDRAGLVMDTGSKVKMRGVQVGRVSQITGGKNQVSLKLDIYPDQIKYIPANVRARIRATTLFSTKYVDLIYPSDPSREAAGRRDGDQVGQRGHRGQHDLPEPGRCAESNRPGEAQRGALRAG